jgi:aspartyl-tRNA(Asn)/glutamyl-tRNA(Gln) amidotransferase subunit A
VVGVRSFSAPARTADSDGDRRQSDLVATMNQVFERHDVVCSPTMAVVAPVAPQGWATAYEDPYMGTNFTFLANSTGRPAASVPCGFASGLPVGMQVIGRPGDEATVLRVCRAFESARPEYPHPPDNW